MSQAPLPPDMQPEGWSRVADAYDAEIKPFLRPFAEEALRVADLEAGERVLDVATGPGTLALLAARAGAHVTATDFAPAMVERLREHAAEEDLETLQAEVMDGQALDLPDGSFDAAFSNFGIIFFPDRARGFRELHRVLRPEGRAVVTAWTSPDEQGFFQVFARAVRKVAPDLPPPPRPPAAFSLADPQQLEAEMREAGFRDVKVSQARGALTSPTPASTLTTLRTTNPVFPALMDRLGEERIPALMDAILQDLTERFGDGPVTLDGEAHVAMGRR